MQLVLVIVADEKMSENIGEILEISGYRVEYAFDGLEGLQKVFSRLPDLVICDIYLPGLVGYEILDSVRSLPDTRDIPFILLTDTISSSDHNEQESFLSIPFDYTQLITAVERHLKAKERSFKKIPSHP